MSVFVEIYGDSDTKMVKSKRSVVDRVISNIKANGSMKSEIALAYKMILK